MRLKLLLIGVAIFLFAGSLHAQWVRTNGPYGGLQSLFGVFDTTLFASNTTQVTIGELTNQDRTWKNINFPLPRNRYLRVFATFGSKLLVGLDSNSTGSTGNSIYLSTDRGSHWHLSSSGFNDNNVQCFAVNDSFIFPGSYEHGVFRSSDSGATWIPVNEGLSYYYITSLISIPGCVFAATNDGSVFRSRDNGLHWTETDSTPLNGIISPGALLFVDSGSKIIVSILNGGIFSSTNAGVTWDSLGFPGSTVYKIVRCGRALIAATNKGMYISTNDGITWDSNNTGLTNTLVGDVVVMGSTLFISTVNGSYYSTDTAQHWQPVGSDPRFVLPTNVLLADGQNLIAGTPAGVYFSRDNGFSWTERDVGLTDVGISALAVAHTLAGPIFFVGTGSGPFRSFDYGRTWSLIDSGFPNYPSDHPGVYSLALVDTTLFAAAGYGNLVRSTNYGTTWAIIPKSPIELFFKVMSNGQLLYADGVNNGEHSVFLSTDQAGYLQLLPPFSNTVRLMNALGMDSDAFDGVRLFADAYGDAFRAIVVSTDSGLSWRPFNSGIDTSDANSIASFCTDESYLYCGTYRGFSFTSNKRDRWTKFNSGLLDSSIQAIASSTTNVFVGTDSGVWRLPLADLNHLSRVSDASQRTISQNLVANPNPFRASTTISFTTQISGRADISVVNQLGREVAHIFSGELNEGEHSFLWTKSALISTAVYECLVRTKAGMLTIPIVVQ